MDNVGPFVSFHAVCGDKHMLERLSRLGDLTESRFARPQFALVILSDDVWRFGVFNFADVYHLVVAIDEQVDLAAFPFGSVAVGESFARPRIGVAQHAKNAKFRLDLAQVLQADLLKSIAFPNVLGGQAVVVLPKLLVLMRR